MKESSTEKTHYSRKVSCAPMLDWTDRHFRYLMRLVSRHMWLYSEMVTTGAILYGNNTERFLGFSAAEHPLALQLGGSEPDELGKCSKIVEEFGYDEVNLNVGCPSDRVQSGRFGACLMAEPGLVAECIQAMIESVSIPVSIKTRIGIDHNDDYEQLQRLVEKVKQTGCRQFIIHARKAWLDGLNPKENRDIPPLRYDFVYQLKHENPELEIIINGGITSLAAMQQHLEQVDGVMIGREAYHNTYLMSAVDQIFYGEQPNTLRRRQIIRQYADYVERQLSNGVPLNHMTRHVLGLVHGCQGARAFRRLISENAHKKSQGPELLLQAADLLDTD